MPLRKTAPIRSRRRAGKAVVSGGPDASRFESRELLAWYHEAQRELPWRPTAARPANAYHVLVSEAMLQQTQVATVVAYFHRFIAAFPTVHALAETDEQRVLALWQGLGYYRRARNLHAAAQVIVERFDGLVPSSVEELLRLPGVGRYTAGAVASIAHDTPAPIVDGNVARVLARYFLLTDPIDQPATLARLWRLATTLVTTLPAAAGLRPRPPGTSAPSGGGRGGGGPGDFNQALMELGALVCTPRSPRCMVCPLRGGCAALAAGRVEQVPVKMPRKKPTDVTHRILALRHRDGRYLFTQRPDTGLWANLWQLLTFDDLPPDFAPERVASDAAESNVTSWIDLVRDDFALTITPPRLLATFIHQTTHRTVRFELHAARVTKSGRKRVKAGMRWCNLGRDLDGLPLSVPQRKAVKIIHEGMVKTSNQA